MTKKETTQNLSVATNYSINESYPFLQSHPAHLRTLANLFGIKDATEVGKAKILELGCGSGGNLIPMAYEYPNATFVGVDSSADKICLAQKQAKEVGLKNIEFKTTELKNLDKALGSFDYIIAHNIFSLVSEKDQEAILEICKNRLTASGVAYVGYNTLPGWNVVRSIRDMMRYHSQMFAETTDKATQSRLLVDFIKNATKDTNTPYATILQNEAAVLANYTDNQLIEHLLEDTNTQFYFHEFMNEARKHNLQYLADANLASMYIGNLSDDVATRLAEVGDIVRTEQYMDFIVNRRFRATLLCNQNIQLKRDISFEDMKDMYMSIYVAPEKALAEVDLNKADEALNFAVYSLNGQTTMSTTSPAMKAIMYSFAESATQLKATELATVAAAKLKGVNADQVKQEFAFNAGRLVLSGYLNISSEPKKFVTNISEKPQVSDVARAQASAPEMFWVTNMRHERYPLNIVEKYMMALMDGKRTKTQIVDALAEHVKKGELELRADDKPVTDEKVVKEQLAAFYDQAIAKFAPSALLVA
jgi:methyltransferase-like protein/SAM-dependent methyltransferase